MDILKKYKTIIIVCIIIILTVLVTALITIKVVSRGRNLETSQRAYNLPTAAEIFRLRSECAALGQKIIDNNTIGSALTQSQISHYNPATNRCYIQLTVQSANLSGDYFSNYLFDGQTENMLAFTKQEKGKKDIGFIYGGPEKNSKSDPSEGIFNNTNDYINEVMKDDWKQ